MSERPYHVDEHAIVLSVGPAAAYAAVRSYADGLTAPPTGPAGRLLHRLLGTEPASGFEVADEQPPRLLSLAGHHRFSRYVLDFRVEPAAGGSSTVTAVTWADFPGRRGAVYRALVVGSRGHVVAVRRMLAAIHRRAQGT